jgi:hypothetical protein
LSVNSRRNCFIESNPGLRGDRTTIHRNLCICLLCAEILLVCGLDATENGAVCATVAGFLGPILRNSV